MRRFCVPSAATPRNRTRGFTLIELMITLTVLAVIMIVLTTVIYSAARNKVATANRIESSQQGRVAVDMLGRDLRTAGYGVDMDQTPTQPPIAYIDSTEVILCANLNPFPDTTTVAALWVPQSPSAYDPAGNPKPFPLTATSWTPPMKYVTGAELVRWTLDLNNDGAVDATDLGTTLGGDASRTSNPNDYVLARQVYGDIGGGSNGPVQSDVVALIRKPASGGVPPLFIVYLRGETTPWNWANGAVPAAQLRNIERVLIHVRATSARPDWRGVYAETPYRTEVNSFRNTPDLGNAEYAVDGYVYEEKSGSPSAFDGTDVPLPGVSVRLGGLTAITNSSGYYNISAPAGNYVLKHTPPPGFGVFTNPDSFNITVPPGVSRTFADTARSGGWVDVYVFEDDNENGIKDGTEPWRPNEQLTMTPGGAIDFTDASGHARLFSTVGAWSVALAVQDSFLCLNANPATGTMIDGGTGTYTFRTKRAAKAWVRGRVFHDRNGNQIQDGIDNGLQNVWVAVISSTGSVIAYQYTNATGDYTIEVPANSPPGTNVYHIECVPQNGYYASTATTINNILLTAGQTLNDQNFGLNSFQMINLTASRVLSLASGNLIEKDWTGSGTGNARRDADLILGADANGTDQLSVWFNDYDANPLFNTTRDYSRTAPNAVLALAADSMSTDPAPFSNRLDLVTGTKKAATGNFFVWVNQNSSGNEGYVPASYSQAYTTSDLGDVQCVVTANVAGGNGLDIIVGTKSPTNGEGTIEIWRSSDAPPAPTFNQLDIYPPKGSIPGGKLGEVNAIRKNLQSVGRKPQAGNPTLDRFSRLVLGDSERKDAFWRNKRVGGFRLGDDLSAAERAFAGNLRRGERDCGATAIALHFECVVCERFQSAGLRAEVLLV